METVHGNKETLTLLLGKMVSDLRAVASLSSDLQCGTISYWNFSQSENEHKGLDCFQASY